MDAQSPKRRGRPPAGGREAILAAALELLRERGIARMTTREVADLAGVSEASVFYHYTDRAGLLKAVFAEGLQPLRALSEEGFSGPDRRQVMTTLGETLGQFLDEALPVMNAAQSDVELRQRMSEYMSEEQLGPHRGVNGLGAYLAAEQEAGRVRADVDTYAVGLMFIGACFLRAFQRQLPINKSELPSLEDVVTALDLLLAPA